MHGETQPASVVETEVPLIVGPIPHDQLGNYEHRIVVAGSRHYADWEFFSEVMRDTVDLLQGMTFVFVSGVARTGADDMIIRWCKENGHPWAEFAADWDTHGKSAGYVRNADMGKIMTRLLTFWDGMSKGTKHMIGLAREKCVKHRIFIVEIPKPLNTQS